MDGDGHAAELLFRESGCEGYSRAVQAEFLGKVYRFRSVSLQKLFHEWVGEVI